jgi:hypothetical protein
MKVCNPQCWLKFSFGVRIVIIVLEMLFDIDSFFVGVQKGHFHISADLIGNMFRSSTRGATPYNNVLLDTIYSFMGCVRTRGYFSFLFLNVVHRSDSPSGGDQWMV